MSHTADLHAARAEHEAWQRADDESAHDRDPRRVRVMRIVAAERVRMIEQRLRGDQADAVRLALSCATAGDADGIAPAAAAAAARIERAASEPA